MHRVNPLDTGWARTLPLLLCAALWLAFASAVSADAPELELKDLSGAQHRIAEYIGRGRWTIVTAWSARCPICRREIYHMTFLHEEHKDRDIDVLGLCVDGYARHAEAQAFADEQSLNFPSLMVDRGDVVRLVGKPLRGTPTYYFFAPDGRLRATHVGAMTQREAEATIAALKRRSGST